MKELFGIVEKVINNESIILTEDGVKKVSKILNEGDVVNLETLERVDIKKEEILKRLEKKIEKEIEEKASFNEFEKEILNNVEFFKKIKETAKFIKLSIFEQRDFIIRFHSDADGVCGALAIKSLMNEDYFGKSFFIPQKAACYSEIELENDNFLSLSLNRPILIFIDFSPNEKMLSQIKFETIIIDHHPTSIKTSINPWNFGMDSKITAGLLCCIVAKLASKKDFDLLEKISLHGDRSQLLKEKEEKFLKMAIAIDFLISKKKISSIEKILNDEERMYEEYKEAKNLIENALTLARKFEKVIKVGEYTIYILNLKKQKTYPQPGKLVSIFHEGLNDEKVVTIGISKNAFSVRVGKEVLEKMDVFSILEGIGASFGGHKNAFSVKLDKENIVLKRFVKELQTALSK
jgi:RecJ-like exonuclease